MRPLIFLITPIIFIAWNSCALSPSREVLNKGQSVINVSLGGAIVDQVRAVENIPLPVNLGIGAFYGVSDSSTLGMTLYPLPLLAGDLLLEPAGIFNIVRSNFVQQLNTEFVFPTRIEFNNPGIASYPTIGICPVLGDDQWKIYTVIEIQFDFTDELKIHINWRFGGEYQEWANATLGAEAGLLDIGEQSTVSPFSRAGIGVPVFTVGSSINLN